MRQGRSHILVGVVVGLLVLLAVMVSFARPPKYADPAVLAFSKLPVSYGGRYQPWDSIARNALVVMSGRDKLRTDEGETVPAMVWLLDVLAARGRAVEYKAIRIDHPDLKTRLGITDHKRKRFSYAELRPQREILSEQATLARQVDRSTRSLYQRKVVELESHVQLLEGLLEHESFYPLPPRNDASAVLPNADGRWQSMREGVLAVQHGEDRPVLMGYIRTFQRWRSEKPGEFAQAVAALQREVEAAAASANMGATVRKAKAESWLNRANPFRISMVMYVLVALLAIVSWAALPRYLLAVAWALLLVAVLPHTLGIAMRVWLSGRPPVTNLYSSAAFIGWSVAVLSLLVEPFMKNGLGLLTGAVAGFTTLIIARGLAADGDTLAVLQAVLDTNFWLTTHVLTITLGYGACFVGGLVGILYILAGVFTPSLRDREREKRMRQVIYGVTCFALLLSFVGTVLGGIWADQSWGRFWGWDPKENGALIIVLWNAIILHARWGGMIKGRGLACLAVFGNVVTAWSWFGVNMLGAGLHSYGFMDSAMFWLLLFVTSQVAIIALGALPREAWASFRPKPAAQT